MGLLRQPATVVELSTKAQSVTQRSNGLLINASRSAGHHGQVVVRPAKTVEQNGTKCLHSTHSPALPPTKTSHLIRAGTITIMFTSYLTTNTSCILYLADYLWPLGTLSPSPAQKVTFGAASLAGDSCR